ncbi:BnaA03g52620D [Brassica napus]|uniref:BnaA03g52620D protein n=2 Tax=Brassica TaxID=3705 RepID=A0A078I8D7_BRANA|nr:BnaA03g52620D [Brassica napus]VDC84029.1 unnamed protein product [Brassica rapa]
MCSNIRSGQLSDWITDSCRGSVSIILGGLNPQLADIIEDMQPEIMESEGNDTIVDLVNVKLGCYYELVVTSYSGLHRYRMGDVLQVTGFYNSAPQFKFIRRQNVVLSVYLEATMEEDLLNAVTNATQLLKSSDIMLRDFTCYPHISTVPGHYVLYWELKGNNNDDINELIDTNVLMECCSVVEESLDALYRKFRSKDGSTGALEIRVVQQGTFDSLMEYFIAQGASIGQYKTPRCIKSSAALELLENRVTARFFSDKLPHVDTLVCVNGRPTSIFSQINAISRMIL